MPKILFSLIALIVIYAYAPPAIQYVWWMTIPISIFLLIIQIIRTGSGVKGVYLFVFLLIIGLNSYLSWKSYTDVNREYVLVKAYTLHVSGKVTLTLVSGEKVKTNYASQINKNTNTCFLDVYRNTVSNELSPISLNCVDNSLAIETLITLPVSHNIINI